MLSARHQRRWAREAPHGPRQLYFNVSAFGRELQLRLTPNTRLVAPGAVVEWYEDSADTGANSSHSASGAERLWKREPLWTNCAYVGDITDIPGAAVAISNCDGLVRLLPCICVWCHTLCTAVVAFTHMFLLLSFTELYFLNPLENINALLLYFRMISLRLISKVLFSQV